MRPGRCQMRSMPSLLPVAISSSDRRNLMACTDDGCGSERSSAPVRTSQMRAVLSLPPEATRVPSGLKTTLYTALS